MQTACASFFFYLVLVLVLVLVFVVKRLFVCLFCFFLLFMDSLSFSCLVLSIKKFFVVYIEGTNMELLARQGRVSALRAIRNLSESSSFFPSSYPPHVDRT